MRDSVRRYTVSPLVGALLGVGFWWVFTAELGDGGIPYLGLGFLLVVLSSMAAWILSYHVLKWARVGRPGVTAGWGMCISVGLTLIVLQRQPMHGWWLVVVGVVAFLLGAVLASGADRTDVPDRTTNGLRQ